METAADFLLSRRNAQNGSWPLNIEEGLGAPSIVNTMEALYVINRAGRTLPDPECTQSYLKQAVADHIASRGDRLRYITFALVGLLEAGVQRDDPLVMGLAGEIEGRYVQDEGWKEDPEGRVRLWSTFHALSALARIHDAAYLESRYQKLVSRLIREARRSGNSIGFDGKAGVSLAATAYLKILTCLVWPDAPDIPGLKSSLLRMMEQALASREVMEVEAIPGTDWHHYSYCWGVKACHSGPEVIDEHTYRVTIETLRFVDTLFRDGRGFLEPGKDICNVRSNYNNVVALDSIMNGFDPGDYIVLAAIMGGREVQTVEKSIFLSFSYADQDRELVDGLRQLLSASGHIVITAEKNPMGSLSRSILQKIREAEKFLVVMTCRDKKENGKYTTSAWLLEEKGAAIALGKPFLMMVEEGIDPGEIGGLQGDDQRIHFTRNNFAAKVAEVLRMLG